MHRWLIAAFGFFTATCNIAIAQSSPSSTTAKPAETQQVSPLLDGSDNAPAPARIPVKPEDWTVLSIEKSNLPVESFNGPVLSRVEGEGYVRELVRLQWRAADPIEVYVVRPKGVKNPPVILYLYDFTSGIERFRDDGWCSRMTKNGFAAVGFVSAVSDERLRAPRPMKQWFVSELQESLAASTHDVQMILNYLGGRGDVDAKRVGMFGQGSGGAVAILAAAADKRIEAIDVMDPWGDWPDWLKESQQIPAEERPRYLAPQFVSKVSNLEPVNYLPELKDRALRVEQTLDDPVTPRIVQDRIKASVPKQGQLVRYKGWSEFRDAHLSIDLSAWLREQIRPQSGSINN